MKKKKDDRILDDLSAEELEDLMENPHKWRTVIDNSNDYYMEVMYPNREPGDDEGW